MSYPQQGGYGAPPPGYPPPGGGYGPYPPPRRRSTGAIVGFVGVVVVAVVAVVLAVVLTGGDDGKATAGGTGSVHTSGAALPGGSNGGSQHGGTDSSGSNDGGSDEGSDGGSDGGDGGTGDGGPSPEAMADEVVRVVEQHDTETIRRYACTEQEAADLYSELSRYDGIQLSATVNDVQKSGDTAQASITMSAGGHSEDFTVEMAKNDGGLWCVTGI
ncbi:hypothetical protein [Actinophytocola sp.]|uniref:hypothetical protein n=1 Tax=Actinophytocola sp. TaxID=1872138 RepID=UPI00389AD3F4